jgi:hypothetical protein
LGLGSLSQDEGYGVGDEKGSGSEGLRDAQAEIEVVWLIRGLEGFVDMSFQKHGPIIESS